jgi:chemotaxis family two-component system response regulator Rcp1
MAAHGPGSAVPADPDRSSDESRDRTRAHCLLVEDSDADAYLFEAALRNCGRRVHLTRARNGAAAIASLEAVAGRQAPRPSLVVLDLNLPIRDGWEVLEHVKSSPALRQIPVVVLSNSHAHTDVQRAYAGGASSFVMKGPDWDEFVKAVEAIARFWCDLAALPGDGPTSD